MTDTATLTEWAAATKALQFVTHAVDGDLVPGKVNLLDTSGGALAMVLPDPEVTRQPVDVKVTSPANPATITVSGGGTISGRASIVVGKGDCTRYLPSDPDYVSVGVAPTAFREVFFNAAQYDAARGDFRVCQIGASAANQFTFAVPADFGVLVGLVLLGMADTTVAGVNIDIASDYGGVGQAFNVHSESDVASTYGFTDNLITEVDLAGIYSALAAGDYCGLTVTHNAIGAIVDYLGIVLRYTPA